MEVSEGETGVISPGDRSGYQLSWHYSRGSGGGRVWGNF